MIDLASRKTKDKIGRVANLAMLNIQKNWPGFSRSRRKQVERIEAYLPTSMLMVDVEIMVTTTKQCSYDVEGAAAAVGWTRR